MAGLFEVQFNHLWLSPMHTCVHGYTEGILQNKHIGKIYVFNHIGICVGVAIVDEQKHRKSTFKGQPVDTDSHQSHFNVAFR